MVTDGSWPVWLTLSAPAPVVTVATEFSGTSFPVDERTYSIDSAAGSLLELRRHAQDHLILIVRRVDLRDLTRAIGVVERRLHLIHRQAERRNAIAIHVDLNLRIVQPQVAVDVLDAGQRPHLVFEQRRRAVELDRVGVLQRELIGAARTLLAAQVDRRLIDHEHAHARHLRDLRAQVGNDLIDGPRALGARLQVDRNPALIEPPVPPPPPAPKLLRVRDDVRILGHDLGHLGLVPHHLLEADALNRLRPSC